MDCDGEFALEISSRDSDFVMMGTQLSGAGNNTGALIVWESTDTSTSEGDLFARLYRADDGRIFQAGGGCGLGGTATSTCAIIGNTNHTLRVRGAPTARAAYVVISAARTNVPCGSCTIVADPFVGFVQSAGTTNFDGNGSSPLAIPFNFSLVGRRFFFQWWIASGTSCFSYDLSNALEVEIEQ